MVKKREPRIDVTRWHEEKETWRRPTQNMTTLLNFSMTKGAAVQVSGPLDSPQCCTKQETCTDNSVALSWLNVQCVKPTVLWLNQVKPSERRGC